MIPLYEKENASNVNSPNWLTFELRGLFIYNRDTHNIINIIAMCVISNYDCTKKIVLVVKYEFAQRSSNKIESFTCTNYCSRLREISKNFHSLAHILGKRLFRLYCYHLLPVLSLLWKI